MKKHIKNCHGVIALAVTSTLQKDTISVARIRCKLWSCPYCAKKNKDQWRKVLHDRLPEISAMWSWHTFTSGSHDTQTIDEATDVLKSGWEKLIKRLKRHYGTFSYVRVVETHKSGYPHLHCLFGFHVPDSVLITPKRGKPYWHSNQIAIIAVGAGYGSIMSSENKSVTVGKSLNDTLDYATKYMTKRNHDNAITGLRFIQTSRDIKYRNLKNSVHEWELKPYLLEDEIYANNHHDVTIRKDITSDDFIDYVAYPPELFLSNDN